MREGQLASDLPPPASSAPATASPRSSASTAAGACPPPAANANGPSPLGPPPPPPASRPSRARGFNLSLPPSTPSVSSSTGANPFDALPPTPGPSSSSQPTPTGAFAGQQHPATNPWAHLMASSGAPTPSLKGAFSPFTFGGVGGSGPLDAAGATAAGPAGRGRAGPSQGVLSPDVKAMREMSLSPSTASPPAGHSPFHLQLGGRTSKAPAASGPPPPQSAAAAASPGPALQLPPAKPPFAPSPPGGAAGGAGLSLPRGRMPSGAVGGRAVFASSNSHSKGSPAAGSPNGSSSASHPVNGSAASTPAIGPSQIRLVSPLSLPSPLPSTYLLLDLRTHALFTASRLQGAIPVTIPSTLLRRPNFTLAKLIPMLDSEQDRARVLAFKDGGKVDAVVVYDQDGSSAADGGTLVGLLSKFRRDGFGGELWAVKGGFLSVLKHARSQDAAQTGGVRALVDERRIETSFRAAGTVNGRELPMTAFQSTSTATSIMSPALMSQQHGLPTNSLSFLPGSSSCSCPPGQHIPSAHTAPLPTPGGGGLFAPNGPGGPWEATSPSTSSTAQAGQPGLRNFTLTPNTSSLQAANPFFDNIRQNVELSHGGITERIPLDLPPSTVARAGELPNWLADLATCGEKEAAERLAVQFECVERGELKRLQGVMSYHARFGGTSDPGSGDEDGEYFPYSITAGLEKGQKNRFRNIWPFDHARVRLADHCVDDGSDYINASFIQPRATHKRYIATQGPLPSTYRDFWTVCWEQNVRVIVMLTKQHEGGQVKCGDYWSDRTFGPLTLHPVGVEGNEEDDAESDGGSGSGGFFFAPPRPSSSRSSSFSSSVSNAGRPSLIKRSFHLTHANHPDEPARLVTQLQYVSWPDFDIPESPADLLSLIRQVNELNDAAAAEASETDRAPPGPTVVHCSAGVGRTGSYVVVDAVLDAVKRDMASRRESRKPRQRTFSTASSVGTPGSNPPPAADLLRPSNAGGGNNGYSVASPRSMSGSVSPVPPPTPPQLRRLPSPFDSGDASPSHPSTASTSRRPSMDMPAPAVESGMEIDYAKVIEHKARSTAGFGVGQHRDALAMSDSSVDANEQSGGAAGRAGDGAGGGGVNSLGAAAMSPYSHGPSSVHNGSQTSLGQFGDMNLMSPSLGEGSRRGSIQHWPSGPPASSQESSPASVTPSLPESDVPRNTQRPEEQGSPTELAELRAPVFSILADMRQQRMSLCQTLRQYVFVYRVVFQGVLDIIDEERKGVADLHSDDKKRQASPTNLHQSLSKRPSLKLPKSQGRTRRGSTKASPSLGSIPAPPVPASGAAGHSPLGNGAGLQQPTESKTDGDQLMS